jgi:regulator of protease activity HflC (stomatin/prohibitin superfamily)
VAKLLRTTLRQAIGERSWDDARETTRELQSAILRAAEKPASDAGAQLADVDVKKIERASA